MLEVATPGTLLRAKMQEVSGVQVDQAPCHAPPRELVDRGNGDLSGP